MQSSIPPGRKRFCKWILRSAIGIVVAIGISLAIALPRIFSAPLPVVDYKQKERELVLSWLPEETRGSDENAVVLLTEAFELFEQSVAEIERDSGTIYGWNRYLRLYPGIDDEEPSELVSTPAERQAALAELERQGLFELIEQAGRARRALVERPAGEAMLSSESTMRFCAAIRWLTQVARYRAQVLARDQKAIEAVAALSQLEFLARTAHHIPGILPQLTAYSITKAAIVSASEWERPIDQLPAEALERLITVLEDWPHPPPLSRSLEAERLSILEFYQAWYVDTSETATWKKPGNPRWLIKLEMTQAEVNDSVNAFFDTLIEWIDRPTRERDLERPRLIRIVGKLPDRFRSVVSLGSYDRAAHHRDAIITQARLTHLLLAIELHRARHGSLPESLDDLVPDILDEIPADLFEPEGGFRYRVIAGGADYVLYSVGFDGQDDGGAAEQEADHQALIGVCTGCDYVIHGGPASEVEGGSDP